MKSSQGLLFRQKLPSSKNVNEERDYPVQIVLGTNNPDFCALEHWGTPWFLFDERDANNKQLCMNDSYMNLLKKIWAKRAFKQLADEVHGKIVMHAIWKFASTWVSEHGMSPSEVELR